MWLIKFLEEKLIPHFPEGCKFLLLIDDRTRLATQLQVLIPEQYRKVPNIRSVTFYLRAFYNTSGLVISISNTVDHPFSSDSRLKILSKAFGIQVLGIAFLNFSHDFKQLRSSIIHDR